MKKLILISALLIAVYMIVRQNLTGNEAVMPEKGLEDLPKEEKVRALNQLKVFYPKKPATPTMKARKQPRKVERAFFQGDKEDFQRLEKVQYLDERGNPVNLNEEGEP